MTKETAPLARLLDQEAGESGCPPSGAVAACGIGMPRSCVCGDQGRVYASAGLGEEGPAKSDCGRAMDVAGMYFYSRGASFGALGRFGLIWFGFAFARR